MAGLAGCQLVFPLEHDEAAGDASPPDDTIRGDGSDGDGGDADRDADGVADSADNCVAIANADQHDEDGDQIGDVCDNCPHVGTPDQTNADGDDLGDACDTSAAVDCIARFDPLTSLQGWTVTSGGWAIQNNALLQSDAGAADALVVSDTTFTRNSVEIGARIVSLGSASPRSVGVWTAVKQVSPITGVLADLRDPAGKAELAVAQLTNGIGTGLQTIPLNPSRPLAAGDLTIVSIDQRLSTLLISRASDGSSIANSSVTRTSTDGRIALRTNHASVAFDYVLVVERNATTPCPPRQ